jgi:26S proteasome regulatory subunit N3
MFSHAKACANASIACLKNLNRRTIDVLAFRLYSYYSYAHEVTNGF